MRITRGPFVAQEQTSGITTQQSSPQVGVARLSGITRVLQHTQDACKSQRAAKRSSATTTLNVRRSWMLKISNGDNTAFSPFSHSSPGEHHSEASRRIYHIPTQFLRRIFTSRPVLHSTDFLALYPAARDRTSTREGFLVSLRRLVFVGSRIDSLDSNVFPLRAICIQYGTMKDRERSFGRQTYHGPIHATLILHRHCKVRVPCQIMEEFAETESLKPRQSSSKDRLRLLSSQRCTPKSMLRKPARV